MSKIPEDRTVESRRAKRQSCSPLQELCVGTDFVEFQQLREVGVFSYLVYFRLKSHLKWYGLYEAVSGHLFNLENWD